MKGVRIWSFSIPYFHIFRLILEIPTQREILLLIVIAQLKYDFLFIVLIFRTTITFLMFKKIMIWYCWTATAEWNMKVENILKIRRIKVEKNEDENFHFFYLK